MPCPTGHYYGRCITRQKQNSVLTANRVPLLSPNVYLILSLKHMTYSWFWHQTLVPERGKQSCYIFPITCSRKYRASPRLRMLIRAETSTVMQLLRVF